MSVKWRERKRPECNIISFWTVRSMRATAKRLKVGDRNDNRNKSEIIRNERKKKRWRERSEERLRTRRGGKKD